MFAFRTCVGTKRILLTFYSNFTFILGERRNLIFIVISGTLLLLEDPENALKAMRHACTLAQNQPIVILDTAVLCYKNGLTDETVELVMKFEQLIGKQNNETKPLEVSIIMLYICTLNYNDTRS